MPISCVIVFDDNPYGTYYAGQVMSGKVTLQTEKVKQVKAVALQINGFAYTSWTERHTRQNERHSRRYHGHEDYLASITYLLGSELSQSVNIEPGVHTYNFGCHIPIVCPTSFEGFHGHIRYTVKVVLQRPWKFDETFTKGFTVIRMVDLNYESPIIRLPAACEIQKTFCCGPCRSEPLTLNVSMPQSGYVPGQIIPVGVLVTNDSNVPVRELKIALVMLITYFSQHPRSHAKVDNVTVTKLKGESVLRQCTKNFTYDLLIPATPPTSLNHCRLVQIGYQLEVEAKVKGTHANEVVCIPVTIGNVPLMNVIQQQPTSGAMMQRGLLDAAILEGTTANGNVGNPNEKDIGFEKEMPVMRPESDEDINAIQSWPMEETIQANTSTSSPWGGAANIPPPCYEEAIHMAHANITAEEAHDYGQSDFAPRYPVFNIPAATAPNPNETNGGYTNLGFEPNKSTWL